jgi:hypothetical protein
VGILVHEPVEGFVAQPRVFVASSSTQHPPNDEAGPGVDDPPLLEDVWHAGVNREAVRRIRLDQGLRIVGGEPFGVADFHGVARTSRKGAEEFVEPYGEPLDPARDVRILGRKLEDQDAQPLPEALDGGAHHDLGGVAGVRPVVQSAWAFTTNRKPSGTCAA